MVLLFEALIQVIPFLPLSNRIYYDALICNWYWFLNFRWEQLLLSCKMLFVYLVSCLLRPTYTFMGLMRRKLTLTLDTATTYFRLREFILKLLSVKSSKYGRDKNLLVRLHWQRKLDERLKSKGSFRCVVFNCSASTAFVLVNTTCFLYINNYVLF